MIIKNQNELIHLCNELSTHPYITVDTEFLREKTYYPKLCLIQLGDPNGKARAVDPLEGNLNLTPLYDLMTNKKVLKIFHAARQDLEIFYHLTGKVVEPFFDTQIAAMVCGYGDSVGYESLVRNITGGTLDKGVQFTDWSNRPLTQRQIDYALGDVTHLVKLYEHLSAELDKRGRTSWVQEEERILANPATYENPPQDAWKRVKLRSPKPKTLAILRDLAAWREEKAQERNIPRAWVLRDEALADMATQAPQDVDQLARIRNVSKDMAQSSTGEALLKIIKKAEKSDKKSWPKVEKKAALPPTATALADILKMLLKVQCTQNDVAAKLVASNEDIEQIAVHDNPDVPAMKGWRYEVFGKYAQELKTGELAIGMNGAKIAKYKIPAGTGQYE